MQLPSYVWAVPTGGLLPAASRGFTQGVHEPTRPTDRLRSAQARLRPPILVSCGSKGGSKSCAAHLDAKRMWTPAECWAVKRPPNSRLHRRALTCCCHAATCVATRSHCAWPCNCREYEVNKCGEGMWRKAQPQAQAQAQREQAAVQAASRLQQHGRSL